MWIPTANVLTEVGLNIIFKKNTSLYLRLDAHLFLFCLVSRVIARSENYEMDLTLDVNSELYPLDIAEKFSLVLASSLSLDSTNGTDTRESWRERAPGERDLSDEYEYVMFGKVYRYDDSTSGSGATNVAAGQKV